jgi:hypothetical protein
VTQSAKDVPAPTSSTTNAASHTPLAPGELEVQATPSGSHDVFDQAIAAQQPPPAEATPTQEPPATEFAAKVTRQDPFGEMTIALSADKDGPKMRLYRSQRFQQMAIQLDEKPDEGIRQQLRESGWTWRPAEGAWTKQLGERPGETHRQAQELFTGIANEIRQANGLEPVAAPAQSR